MAHKQRALETLELAAQALANALNLPPPRGQVERDALCRAARHVLEAPDLEGVALSSRQWLTQSEELGTLINAGVSLVRLRSEFDRAIMPGAWELDLQELRRTLVDKGEGLTRRLSREYRSAEKQLSGLFLQPRPSDLNTRLKLIDTIAEARQYRESIDQHAPLGEELFGSKWSGQASDWGALLGIANWVNVLCQDISNGHIPSEFTEFLINHPQIEHLKDLLEEVRQSIVAQEDTLRLIQRSLEVSRKELLDLGLRSNSLLNYKLLRARGLEVVDERPTEVYKRLVEQGRTMAFQPAAEDELDESGEFVGQPEKDDTVIGPGHRHTDSKLQTNLTSKELQSRLLSTYHLANTFIQEQGVNTLFLALGMLNWYESDDSKEARRAPLFMIPVSLSRSHVQARFVLTHTEEDPEENLSLAEKSRSEFGITLPELPESDGLDIEVYLDTVETAITGMPKWSVDRNSIVLGFFSFSKFLMYRDLDTEIWPVDAKPEDHPVIGALLNEAFNEPAPSIGDDENLDRRLTPSQIRHVVDADSSQTLALVDVNDGRNLIVKGPPGTGKSQTITNMIAEALGLGRTVLFVSEKMAALEVVKRRLDSVGLGDACLELHSHKTTKKTVLEDLKRTLELGRPRLGQIDSDMDTLTGLRDRLNSYCEAVNAPVGETGVSPYVAYGELALLKQITNGTEVPKLEIPDMPSWSQEILLSRLETIKELQSRLSTIGVPREHPFWGTRHRVMLPTNLERLKAALPPAQATLQSVICATYGLADSMDLPRPTNVRDADGLRLAVSRILEAPTLSGLNLEAEEWRKQRKELEFLLGTGAKLSNLQTKYQDILKPESWNLDLIDLRALLDTKGRRVLRFLSSDYRRGKERLSGLCRSGPPSGLAAQLEMLDSISQVQILGKMVSDGESLGQSTFGFRWQGANSEWESLSTTRDWIFQLFVDIDLGNLPTNIVKFLAEGRPTQGLAESSTALSEAVADYEPNANAVVEALALEEIKRYPDAQGFDKQPFVDQRSELDVWSRKINDIHDMVGFNTISDACRDAGMESVLSVAESWGKSGTNLMDAFKLTWHETVLATALSERKELREFDGSNHHRLIQQFKELDTLVLEHNRSKLAMAHWERLPKHEGGGQIGVLKREFEKGSRHLPVRQLITRAGNAIQAIKPVFMMSPLSIATYIPSNSLKFDLVIFDEASQVKPVDAFGAILRANQSVVVGDNEQLPPTNFFNATTQGTEEEEEESETADIQSILGLFASKNAPERVLRWHYRSRHESLIAVSNSEFYDNKLVVFPSPDAGREEVGLSLHYLPDTVYDRGHSRTNQVEARVVAQSVMEHARNFPHLTLGVAALSTQQMQAILDQLEVLRRADPSLEPFFNDHPNEPFFVKNLETVQGDERDVMFISIGYGRDSTGRPSMNFGPLNKEGGYRRLNVLITRAKRRCEVFSNLAAEDIDLGKTSGRGPAALKTFLRYARDGEIEIPFESDHESQSPFEEAVEMRLKDLGYDVRRKIGSAGYFIDLAIVDPNHPGSYILGIECDGASYHSSRWARDRDRLRQQVLEDKGWRIHRIWSTDWYKNPDRQLDRTAVAIEEAKTHVKSPVPQTVTQAVIERENGAKPRSLDSNIVAYKIAPLKIHGFRETLHEMADIIVSEWVAQVVDVESPLHRIELARRITNATGARKVGSRIENSINDGIEHAVRTGNVVRKGDFLWRSGMTEPSIRDRSKLPVASKKIEFVAPEELVVAVRRVVAGSYGIAFDDIAGPAVKLLGFGRVTSDMRSLVEPLITQMVTDGTLVRQGDLLLISNDHPD